MQAERWQQISRLYHAAAQVDALERAAFLDRVCVDDAELREELLALFGSGASDGEALLDGEPELARPSLVGATIGTYAVQALIGAGGMGDVYRARDTRLQRDVALKILPELSALDGDRLARFRREAQTLASLNHPNIAQIYGVEDDRACHALVLELVEGPTLADRIARGALPPSEALGIVRQLVDALQAAHERGIVHRDLKPANIKVRPDGTVKVLDFGLAKAFESGAIATGERGHRTPTITGRGVILGTAAYMAPEQARGHASDVRADVWGVGVTLYEMLTGRAAFAAGALADTVGAVIYRDPDWDGVPAPLQPLVRRCLEKDPARRPQTMADVRGWLDGSRPLTSQRRWQWSAVALAATGLVAVMCGIWFFAPTRAEAPASASSFPIRLQVAPPPQTAYSSYFVVSPDGRYIASVMGDAADERSIWLYSLETGESRPLQSTGRVSTSSIIWSPDSQYIGYVGTDAFLRKIRVAGGEPQTIVKLGHGWGGGAWSPDGSIVIGQRDGGLLRVSATGGRATPLTTLDPAEPEIGHGGPRMLRDGRHFIYSRERANRGATALFVGAVDGRPSDPLPPPLLVTESRPAYAPSTSGVGHLLVVRDGVLAAYPFDERRLKISGDPITIADNVDVVHNGHLAIAAVSASPIGVLAYRDAEKPTGALIWLDRNGRASPITEALDAPSWPRVSPDGTRIAVAIAGNLWVYRTDGRPPIRLTFEGNISHPVWTPDGRRIVFSSDGGVAQAVWSVPSDRVASPEAAGPAGLYRPHAFTPDGDLLATSYVVSAISLGTVIDVDVVRFAPSPSATVRPVVKTPAFEGISGVALSPDGRRLAYTSNVTGDEEVWVQLLDGNAAPVRVSPRGGVEPRWSARGDELYYVEQNRMMSVEVQKGAPLAFSAARLHFEHDAIVAGKSSDDVAADGRVVALAAAPYRGRSPLRVVLNWTTLLSAPARRR